MYGAITKSFRRVFGKLYRKGKIKGKRDVK